MESFNVFYADTELTIKLIREGSSICAYQIFIGELYLAEIYPDHGDGITEPCLVWRSHDIMVPYMVTAIGNAIEDHDA